MPTEPPGDESAFALEQIALLIKDLNLIQLIQLSDMIQSKLESEGLTLNDDDLIGRPCTVTDH